MILLATNKRDVTTDYIVLELERQGVPFFRINTEDFGTYAVTMPGGDPNELTFENAKASLRVSDVRSAYYRRPGALEFPSTDTGQAEYLAAEWSALLRSLWNALDGRWLNSPFAILRAEDKPRQLSLARRFGLSVPRTIISNKPDDVRCFAQGKHLVAKPLRHALIREHDGEKVIFTSRVHKDDLDDALAIARAPFILQDEVRKKSDVRAIVVEDRIFATSIDSQGDEEAQVDWRRSKDPTLPHHPIELPSEVAEACRRVVAGLNLRFAAIDLVEDLDGSFWFLEANPNGQWAWIEQRTAAPISRAIVEALVS